MTTIIMTTGLVERGRVSLLAVYPLDPDADGLFIMTR